MQETRYRAGHGEVVVGYLRQRDGSFRCSLDGVAANASLLTATPSAIDLEVDGCRRTFRVTPGQAGVVFVQDAHGEVRLEELPRFPEPAAAQVTVGGYTAPMPGRVLDIRVKVGDVVTRDQTLVTMEAMKMEHQLTASADGVVAEIRVSPGQQVDAGQLLVMIKAHEDDSGRAR